MRTQETDPSVQADSDTGSQEHADQVLLATGPEKMSFFFKYLLAFTPIILVFICILARFVLDIGISTFSTVAENAISNPTAGSAGGTALVTPALMSGLGPAITGLSPAVSYGTNVAILMIAPVGIFIIIAVIGWSMRVAEVWSGVTLTLASSGIVGLLIVLMTGGAIPGQERVIVYLKWIAFLVQPFSVVATIISLVWLEKFRQSIQYTLTEAGVTVRGGVWQIQKHVFPYSDIGSVVMEQNLLGTRYNFGTVIPVSNTRWGEETSLRGFGAEARRGVLAVA